MIRVLHIINSLDKGGAETNLLYLLKNRRRDDIVSSVVSLGDEGYSDAKLRNSGINVINLNFKRHPLRTIKRLKAIIKDYDVICCWMYLSNYLGYLCAKKYRDKKIIWNVRHSNVKLKGENLLTYFIIRRCAKLSYKVNAILYNGEKARINHEKIKYNPAVGKVMENGCDIEYFSKDNCVGNSFREENGLTDASILLSVGRFHPIKDIGTFISAFAICKNQMPNLKAVVCGTGYLPDNPKLQTLCKKNDIVVGKDIFFLGHRDDVNEIMAVSDYYALHSVSEAFPNSLIQAMASGCLCVSTNVGDAEHILNDKNLIVEPKDYAALAEKIIYLHKLSSDEKKKMSERNMETVKTKFSIESKVKKFEDMISDIVSDKR